MVGSGHTVSGRVKPLPYVLLLLSAIWVLVSACSTQESRKTVVLWHAYQGAEKTALESLVDELNGSRDDLRVKLVSVPYASFADKLTNAIPNGNGPDLFIFSHDRIGDWTAKRLIEPIEFFVDEKLADTFLYSSVSALAYKRSLYGLPLALKSLALFYRTDLVSKPPRTTDELISWGAEFRKEHGSKYPLVYMDTDLYGHAPWLHGFGGKLFTGDGKLNINTPEAEAALKFARDLAKRGVANAHTKSVLVTSMFNDGKAAMAVSGPWFMSTIDKKVPWAVTTMPIVSATGKPAAPFLSVEAVIMSARARDKHRAFEAMKFLTSDHAAMLRARKGRQVVANRAPYRDPQIASDRALSAFRAQADNTVVIPATPAMRNVWRPYRTALEKVINQGTNASDSLSAADREIRDYIRGKAR